LLGLGLLFDSENGGNKLLRNVRELPQDDMGGLFIVIATIISYQTRTSVVFPITKSRLILWGKKINYADEARKNRSLKGMKWA
jgi:hypothetical protein